MSTFQKTNTESREDLLSSDSTTSATPVTLSINLMAVTLTEGKSALTTPDMSDPALTNGGEADETDLEAALDPALVADQLEEITAADLVLRLVIDDQDRALLAKIALDPDLPNALDLAPVPDKVLLSRSSI